MKSQLKKLDRAGTVRPWGIVVRTNLKWIEAMAHSTQAAQKYIVIHALVNILTEVEKWDMKVEEATVFRRGRSVLITAKPVKGHAMSGIRPRTELQECRSCRQFVYKEETVDQDVWRYHDKKCVLLLAREVMES